MEALFFLAIAAVAILAALTVLVHRNPVIGALFLVANLLCVAVLYLLLDAQFLAAIQVIVYAGAIMVLILFVIMLLNLREEKVGIKAGPAQKLLGGITALAFLALLVRSLAPFVRLPAPAAPTFGTAEHVGRYLFSDYFYPFELISLILIVAMAGAVVLAKKRL